MSSPSPPRSASTKCHPEAHARPPARNHHRTQPETRRQAAEAPSPAPSYSAGCCSPGGVGPGCMHAARPGTRKERPSSTTQTRLGDQTLCVRARCCHLRATAAAPCRTSVGFRCRATSHHATQKGSIFSPGNAFLSTDEWILGSTDTGFSHGGKRNIFCGVRARGSLGFA